jgi:hypothetical protein
VKKVKELRFLSYAQLKEKLDRMSKKELEQNALVYLRREGDLVLVNSFEPNTKAKAPGVDDEQYVLILDA